VAPTKANALVALQAPVTQITRGVDIYETNGTTLYKPAGPQRLIEGTVSVDYDRDERRGLDITLDNVDGAMTSDPDGFWYDKVLKPWFGVVTTAGEYKTQLGEFVIDRIDEGSDSATVKVTARDKTKKLMLSKFRQPTSYGKGTVFVELLIQTLANNAGITKTIIPSTRTNLAVDTTFEGDSSRWDAIKALAEAYSYEVFFDPQGYLVVRKFLDPTKSPLSFTFATGATGNVATYSKSTDDTGIFNHIVVVGDRGDDVLPIYAEVTNTQPTSPTRIARLGDRVFTHTTSGVATAAQGLDLAKRLLSVNALENYAIDLEAISIPWLEVGEIVQFDDPKGSPKDPIRFLLTSLSIPLGLGAMSASAKRVTIVG
jgi:hypothetical protein